MIEHLDALALITNIYFIFTIAFIFAVGAIVSYHWHQPSVISEWSDEEINIGYIFYYLPKSNIKVSVNCKVKVIYEAGKLSSNSRIIEQSFSVATDVESDTKALIRLRSNVDPFFSEKLDYHVNSKGLLETADVVSDDRTSQILTSIIKGPETVIRQAPKVGANPDKPPYVKNFEQDFTIDPYEEAKDKLIIPWDIVVENETDKNDSIVIDGTFSLKTKNADGIKVLDISKSEKKKLNGIISRPMATIAISIRPSGHNSKYLPPITLQIIDVSKLLQVPIERRAFAKTENNIGIANGIIVSHNSQTPSSIEGFVSIPIDICKAIISIPAQLLKFRYENVKNNTSYEKAKLDYDRSIMDNLMNQLNKNSELRKIESNFRDDLNQQNEELRRNKDLMESSLKETKNSLNEIEMKLQQWRKPPYQ